MKDELAALALKIRGYCGLDFTKNLGSLEQKLTRRLKEIGLKIEEYETFLKMNPKEWDRLVEYITINETYFFREYNQLTEFQNLLKKRSEKQINVWCVPCSTGEEAYSLAILAKELELSTGNRVRIVASDLNTKMIEHAKKGFYPKKSLSFRRMPENKEYLKKYFIETELGYEVRNEIKQMITFQPFNLADYDAYSKYIQMDFIFCRNVLFYFNEEIVKKIIRSFYAILKSDGYLFLGQAESISSYQNMFVPVHTIDTFYYSK